MRYAIISDVHANETALRAVLKDAKANGAEKIVCLGDVVGYGPLPREAVALVRSQCSETIAGNHDDAVSGRGDASGFVEIAKEAVKRHREALSDDDIAWLRTLPYVLKLEDGAFCAHGDMCEPHKFYYIMEPRDAEANFAATNAQIIFVGHTHVPALFITGRSGAVYETNPQDFTIEGHKRYIVNPGSVGYPREANGKCMSSYVLYDTSDRTVTFRYLPFSIAGVMQRGAEKQRKRLSKSLVAAVAAAAVAACAAALAIVSRMSAGGQAAEPEAPGRAQSVAAVGGGERMLDIETRTVRLGPDVRFVRANVKLGRKSAPVQLHIEFRDASGGKVGAEVSKQVSRSSMEAIHAPGGAETAEVTLRRLGPDDRVVISNFAPSASPK